MPTPKVTGTKRSTYQTKRKTRQMKKKQNKILCLSLEYQARESFRLTLAKQIAPIEQDHRTKSQDLGYLATNKQPKT